MNVVRTVDDLRRKLDDVRSSGASVGFVPTMGALHAGHVSLIRRARAENDVACVSIFVNPAQFGPGEDLDAYPRTLDADLASCEREDVDLVFVPDEAEMYPDVPTTRIVVGEVSEGLEGAHRPGHFEGVALVVSKLFNAVGPCRAYFGEKDAQQLRVVRRMARDLGQPVEVVACPTVREPDGLAMSSRNAYLSDGERARARCLSRALFAMRDAIAAGRDRADEVVAIGHDVVADGDPDGVDYLAVVDDETMRPVDVIDDAVVVCGAIRFGATRLIDNVTAAPPAAPVAGSGGYGVRRDAGQPAGGAPRGVGGAPLERTARAGPSPATPRGDEDPPEVATATPRSGKDGAQR